MAVNFPNLKGVQTVGINIMVAVPARAGRNITMMNASLKDMQRSMMSTAERAEALQRSLALASSVYAMFGAALLTISQSAAQASRDLDKLSTSSRVIANNIGLSTAALSAQVKGIKSQTFTTAEAVEAVNKLNIAQATFVDTAKLAAVAQDLAVAKNMDAVEVLDLLTGAISRASAESLNQLDIGITNTKLFKDYAKSVGTEADMLSVAAKRQAVYNYILERGAVFHGTYAAASSQAAYSMNQLRVQATEAFTSLGKGAVEVFQPLIKLATGVVKAFNSLDESTKHSIGRIATLAGTFLVLKTGMGFIKNTVGYYIPMFKAIIRLRSEQAAEAAAAEDARRKQEALAKAQKGTAAVSAEHASVSEKTAKAINDQAQAMASAGERAAAAALAHVNVGKSFGALAGNATLAAAGTDVLRSNLNIFVNEANIYNKTIQGLSKQFRSLARAIRDCAAAADRIFTNFNNLSRLNLSTISNALSKLSWGGTGGAPQAPAGPTAPTAPELPPGGIGGGGAGAGAGAGGGAVPRERALNTIDWWQEVNTSTVFMGGEVKPLPGESRVENLRSLASTVQNALEQRATNYVEIIQKGLDALNASDQEIQAFVATLSLRYKKPIESISKQLLESPQEFSEEFQVWEKQQIELDRQRHATLIEAAHRQKKSEIQLREEERQAAMAERPSTLTRPVQHLPAVPHEQPRGRKEAAYTPIDRLKQQQSNYQRELEAARDYIAKFNAVTGAKTKVVSEDATAELKEEAQKATEVIQAVSKAITVTPINDLVENTDKFMSELGRVMRSETLPKEETRIAAGDVIKDIVKKARDNNEQITTEWFNEQLEKELTTLTSVTKEDIDWVMDVTENRLENRRAQGRRLAEAQGYKAKARGNRPWLNIPLSEVRATETIQQTGEYLGLYQKSSTGKGVWAPEDEGIDPKSFAREVTQLVRYWRVHPEKKGEMLEALAKAQKAQANIVTKAQQEAAAKIAQTPPVVDTTSVTAPLEQAAATVTEQTTATAAVAAEVASTTVEQSIEQTAQEPQAEQVNTEPVKKRVRKAKKQIADATATMVETTVEKTTEETTAAMQTEAEQPAPEVKPKTRKKRSPRVSAAEIPSTTVTINLAEYERKKAEQERAAEEERQRVLKAQADAAEAEQQRLLKEQAEAQAKAEAEAQARIAREQAADIANYSSLWQMTWKSWYEHRSQEVKVAVTKFTKTTADAAATAFNKGLSVLTSSAPAVRVEKSAAAAATVATDIEKSITDYVNNSVNVVKAQVSKLSYKIKAAPVTLGIIPETRATADLITNLHYTIANKINGVIDSAKEQVAKLDYKLKVAPTTLGIIPETRATADLITNLRYTIMDKINGVVDSAKSSVRVGIDMLKGVPHTLGLDVITKSAATFVGNYQAAVQDFATVASADAKQTAGDIKGALHKAGVALDKTFRQVFGPVDKFFSSFQMGVVDPGAVKAITAGMASSEEIKTFMSNLDKAFAMGIVRRVQNMYAKGMTAQQIYARLEELGYKLIPEDMSVINTVLSSIQSTRSFRVSGAPTVTAPRGTSSTTRVASVSAAPAAPTTTAAVQTMAAPLAAMVQSAQVGIQGAANKVQAAEASILSATQGGAATQGGVTAQGGTASGETAPSGGGAKTTKKLTRKDVLFVLGPEGDIPVEEVFPEDEPTEETAEVKQAVTKAVTATKKRVRKKVTEAAVSEAEAAQAKLGTVVEAASEATGEPGAGMQQAAEELKTAVDEVKKKAVELDKSAAVAAVEPIRDIETRMILLTDRLRSRGATNPSESAAAIISETQSFLLALQNLSDAELASASVGRVLEKQLKAATRLVIEQPETATESRLYIDAIEKALDKRAQLVDTANAETAKALEANNKRADAALAESNQKLSEATKAQAPKSTGFTRTWRSFLRLDVISEHSKELNEQAAKVYQRRMQEFRQWDEEIQAEAVNYILEGHRAPETYQHLAEAYGAEAMGYSQEAAEKILNAARTTILLSLKKIGEAKPKVSAGKVESAARSVKNEASQSATVAVSNVVESTTQAAAVATQGVAQGTAPGNVIEQAGVVAAALAQEQTAANDATAALEKNNKATAEATAAQAEHATAVIADTKATQEQAAAVAQGSAALQQNTLQLQANETASKAQKKNAAGLRDSIMAVGDSLAFVGGQAGNAWFMLRRFLGSMGTKNVLGMVATATGTAIALAINAAKTQAERELRKSLGKTVEEQDYQLSIYNEATKAADTARMNSTLNLWERIQALFSKKAKQQQADQAAGAFFGITDVEKAREKLREELKKAAQSSIWGKEYGELMFPAIDEYVNNLTLKTIPDVTNAFKVASKQINKTFWSDLLDMFPRIRAYFISGINDGYSKVKVTINNILRDTIIAWNTIASAIPWLSGAQLKVPVRMEFVPTQTEPFTAEIARVRAATQQAVEEAQKQTYTEFDQAIDTYNKAMDALSSETASKRRESYIKSETAALKSLEYQSELYEHQLKRIEEQLYGITQVERALDQELRPFEETLTRAEAKARLLSIPLERQRRAIEKNVKAQQKQLDQLRKQHEEQNKALEDAIERAEKQLEKDQERLKILDWELFIEQTKNKIRKQETSGRELALKTEKLLVEDSVEQQQEALDRMREQLDNQKKQQELVEEAAQKQIDAANAQMEAIDEQLEAIQEEVTYAQEELDIRKAMQTEQRIAIENQRRMVELMQEAIQRQKDALDEEIDRRQESLDKAKEAAQAEADAIEAAQSGISPNIKISEDFGKNIAKAFEAEKDNVTMALSTTLSGAADTSVDAMTGKMADRFPFGIKRDVVPAVQDMAARDSLPVAMMSVGWDEATGMAYTRMNDMWYNPDPNVGLIAQATTAAEKLVQAISEAFSKLSLPDWLKTILSSASGMKVFGLMKPMGVEAHAKGFSGLVTSPRHFLVGEAGPEYVQVSPMTSRFLGGKPATHTVASYNTTNNVETTTVVNNNYNITGVYGQGRTPSRGSVVSDVQLALNLYH